MRCKSVIGKCKVEFLDGEARQSAIDNIIMARHEETKNFDYDHSVVARTAVARLIVLFNLFHRVLSFFSFCRVQKTQSSKLQL